MSCIGRVVLGILVTMGYAVATVTATATATVTAAVADTGVVACEVTYVAVERAGARIIVHNTGTEDIDGWTFSFPLDEGIEIAEFWDARLISASGQIVTQHEEHNRLVEPDGAIYLGFQASGTTAATPSPFTVNGVVCGIRG